MYELCIKLELIKELYYDARPNKSQDTRLRCRSVHFMQPRDNEDT